MTSLMEFLKKEEPDESFLQFENFIRVIEIKKTSSESMSTFVDRFSTAVEHFETVIAVKLPEALKAMLVIHRSGVDAVARRQLLTAGLTAAGDLQVALVIKELRRLFHGVSTKTAFVGDQDPPAITRGPTVGEFEKMFEGFLAKKGLKLNKHPKAKPKPKPKARTGAAGSGPAGGDVRTCFWCLKPGHFKAECPSRLANEPRAEGKTGLFGEAYLADLGEEDQQGTVELEEVDLGTDLTGELGEYLAATARWSETASASSSQVFR
jgi:hypothetical protein